MKTRHPNGRVLHKLVFSAAFALALTTVVNTALANGPVNCVFGNISWGCDVDATWAGCCIQMDQGSEGGFWYGCTRRSTGYCVAVGYSGGEP